MCKPTSANVLGIATMAFLIVVGIASPSGAQPGPSLSVSYEYFPYSNLADPQAGTFEEDLKVRVGTLSAEFSLSPVIFSQGKTVWVNTFSYQRFDLDYQNWSDAQGGNRIENTQGIEYTAVLVRQLSDTWNLTAVATPGLHSDFGADLSYDDFNVETALIFGRRFSERLTIGFGAAYSFKFGEGYPLPFVTVAWTNGSTAKIDMLLPVYAELWYLPNPKVEIGLAARVGGDQYHGDPARYGVSNPQLRYSVGTIGPAMKLHLSSKARLTVDAGFSVLRRFEFFDGNDEVVSLDLKNAAFVKAGLQIGG